MRYRVILSIAGGFFLACLVLLFSLSSSAQQEAASRSRAVLEHNSRGVAFMDQFKFEEAIQEFEAVLRLNPQIVPVRVNLGIAHFYQQDYEPAATALQQALEQDSNLIQAHYVLGLIFRNQDRVEEALAAFQKVRDQDPHDPSTNYYLGLLYSRQRDYEGAERYLREVIDREPYNASAHYNLATALFRSGKRDEGQREMEEFRRLQSLFGSTTIGLQYLEQGRYSVALDEIPDRYLPGLDPGESEPRITVTFTNVAASSGIQFRHGGPGVLFETSPAASVSERESAVVPYVGSGVAFADYDSDGRMDLFFANAGGSEPRPALFRNLGEGRFEDVTQASGIDYTGHTMAALWGDYDNDGALDLYLINYGRNVLYHNRGDGTFQDVTESSGTGLDAWGLSGAWVDYDHDGDLDLFIANFSESASTAKPVRFPEDFAGAANSLLRNNGDGSFSDVSTVSGLAGEKHQSVGVICTDFDNSRDIDLYIVNLDAPNQLFSNLRDGTFTDVAARAKAEGVSAGIGVAAGDFDKNSFVDLLLPGFKLNESSLLLNRGISGFESETIELAGGDETGLQGTNALLFDYDNDGDLDVLLVASPFQRSDAGSSRNLFLLENQGGRLKDVSAQTGLDQFSGQAVRGAAVADFDGDGDLDLVFNVNGGQPLLLRNDGGDQNNWVSIELAGTNSNRSGIGTRAEIRSGRLWQKLEQYGGFGFLGQSMPRLHFGLGQHDQLDMIRLLWPGGVLQSEVDRPVNQRLEISELDRKGTSCPILYCWNGTTYQFQTDFLGGSAFGYLLAPGVYNQPDTDEYVKLDREALVLRDGRVGVTLNNQLEEVMFFDQVELVVVDHPSGFEVFPNEKLLPGPPFDPFKLYSVSEARIPVSATDGSGRDLLDRIRRIDRDYAEGFGLLPFKGYSEMHELILDLGPIPGERAILLMHAWIDYADSTSNLAASQAGVRLVPPYLQVQDEAGNWVTVIERMGFPAGLPKTMTVDLSGRFLSASRKVRIVTNMRIYWDQILVESGPSREEWHISRLKPETADLRFKGFPRFFSPDGRRPSIYDYDDLSGDAGWKVHVGGYTRFGDVRPLLLERDDRFVIARSGDEIEIQFDTRHLLPPPAGWVRDYLIFADGFGKDMDPNSASPHFVGPLPFHSMSSFPYPDNEHYPDSEAHRRYLEEWNTRLEEEAVRSLPLTAKATRDF